MYLLRHFFIFILLIAFFSGCGVNRSEEIPYRFPMLSRTEMTLDGNFRFRTDPENKGLLNSYHRPSFNDSSWKKIHVPDSWESRGVTQRNPNISDSDVPYNGYAWYRRWVQVPPEWDGRDLIMNPGKVNDSHVCFWNGHKIGESSVVRNEDNLVIPKTLTKYGESNLLVIRVYNREGPGGIVRGPMTLRPVFPWDELSLSVKSPDNTYNFNPDSRIDLEFNIDNPLDKVMEVSFHISIRDYEKKQIYRERFKMRLNGEGGTSLSLEIPPKPRGHYDCRIDLYGGGLRIKTFWTSFAVTGAPVRFENVQESPFALSGGALFHLSQSQHHTTGKVRLNQQARLGAWWGRNDLWWGAVEPQPGEWEFEKCDSVIRSFSDHSFNLLGILCYSTDWLNGEAPDSPSEISEFCDYARQIVSRYRDDVHYWEVWNEPNIRPFWMPEPDPVIYTELLKETYKTVKQATPEAKVVGLCTSRTDLEFIEKALESGAGEFMDILSVHPYQEQSPFERGPDTQLGKLKDLRELMDRYECYKPIWITECGWPSTGENTERLQAQYLVKFYALTLQEGLVEKIYWFNLTDWGPRFSTEGGHFGLVHMDQTPKPSYAAYYTMTRILHDFRQVQKAELSENMQGVDFYFRNERAVRVIWAENGPAMFSVPEDAKVYNIVGKEIEPEQGKIMINRSPRYIVTSEDSLI